MPKFATKSIIQAGIKRIYDAEDYHNHEYATKLLKQSGIEFKKIPFSPEYVAKYLTKRSNVLLYVALSMIVGVLWNSSKVLSTFLFIYFCILLIVKIKSFMPLFLSF